jgi:hypothetical protein
MAAYTPLYFFAAMFAKGKHKRASTQRERERERERERAKTVRGCFKIE